jgi:hypothetical protein
MARSVKLSPDLLRKAADPPGAARAARRAEPEAAPAPDQRAVPHYRPGRAGKVNVTGYFDPAVKRELKRIALDEDTTIQELLAEALDDLFAKRGKPEIAR